MREALPSGRPTGRHVEERGLDVPQTIEVSPGSKRRVVEQKRLGQSNDRVAESGGLDGRVVPAGASLAVDQVRDHRDDPGLDDAPARGDDSKRCLALGLDELAQRGSVGKGAVEAVEGVEQRRATAPASAGPRGGEDGLRREDDHLADQGLAGAEPAVHGGAPEAQLRGDRLNVDPAPAQIPMERGVEHLLARRRGGPSRPPRRRRRPSNCPSGCPLGWHPEDVSGIRGI